MGSSKTHFTGAYSSVRCLRDVLHCDLPIEIWYSITFSKYHFALNITLRHNRTYENEFKELPRTAVQAFLGIANVSIHTLKQPTHIKRPVWDKEGDWYSDYIGFSSMSRAIWTTTLGRCLIISTIILDAILHNIISHFRSSHYQKKSWLLILTMFYSYILIKYLILDSSKKQEHFFYGTSS